MEDNEKQSSRDVAHCVVPEGREARRGQYSQVNVEFPRRKYDKNKSKEHSLSAVYGVSHLYKRLRIVSEADNTDSEGSSRLHYFLLFAESESIPSMTTGRQPGQPLTCDRGRPLRPRRASHASPCLPVTT